MREREREREIIAVLGPSLLRSGMFWARKGATLGNVFLRADVAYEMLEINPHTNLSLVPDLVIPLLSSARSTVTATATVTVDC